MVFLHVRLKKDHIAILVRGFDNTLFLLDSTGGLGVQAFYLEKFLNMQGNDFYEIMVYRKLVYKIDSDSLKLFTLHVKVFFSM